MFLRPSAQTVVPKGSGHPQWNAMSWDEKVFSLLASSTDLQVFNPRLLPFQNCYCWQTLTSSATDCLILSAVGFWQHGAQLLSIWLSLFCSLKTKADINISTVLVDVLIFSVAQIFFPIMSSVSCFFLDKTWVKDNTPEHVCWWGLDCDV